MRMAPMLLLSPFDRYRTLKGAENGRPKAVPPATVYVYQKRVSRSMSPRKMR